MPDGFSEGVSSLGTTCHMRGMLMSVAPVQHVAVMPGTYLSHTICMRLPCSHYVPGMLLLCMRNVKAHSRVRVRLSILGC